MPRVMVKKQKAGWHPCVECNPAFRLSESIEKRA
jgi:hypothetical protein